MPHHVPHGGQFLPLIQQNGFRAAQDDRRIGCNGFRLGTTIELDHGAYSLARGGGLADRLGAIQGESGNLAEQLIQLAIDDTTGVFHGHDPTSATT